MIHQIMGPSDDASREKNKEIIKKNIGTKVELKDAMIPI